MTKHTPAPWLSDGSTDDGDFVIWNDDCKHNVLEIKHGTLNSADFNLIKSAPELLELLIDSEHMINKSVSGLEKYSIIEWQLFLAKVQKAITKATGNAE